MLALTARSRQFVRLPSLSATIGTEQMPTKFRGVMQSPVTPFKNDFSLDLPTFERLLDFHVRTGATAISWPHHKGESLNLTIAERKLFAEAAVRVVHGRIPVTIHVSALAVEDTMELAQHAQDIGADGILAITPYFWTPSLEAIHAYFVRLCRSIELPVLSEHRTETIDIVRRTAEASPGVAARDYDELMGMFNPTGKFDPKALDVLARSFVEMGSLPQAPDMRTLITERYLPGAK